MNIILECECWSGSKQTKWFITVSNWQWMCSIIGLVVKFTNTIVEPFLDDALTNAFSSFLDFLAVKEAGCYY